mgnify:CR=1 FL=1
MKDEHKKYPVRGFRINNKTYEKLKKLKGRQSWNLFFLELIKYYINNSKG